MLSPALWGRQEKEGKCLCSQKIFCALERKEQLTERNQYPHRRVRSLVLDWQGQTARTVRAERKKLTCWAGGKS